MKQNMLVLATLFVMSCLITGLLGGCGGQEEQQPVTGEDVKEEAKEAVDTTMAYTEVMKEEYQKALTAKLEEYEQKMNKLQAQGQEMASEAKHEFNEQVQVLQHKKQALEQKAAELQSASGEAWDDLRSGVDAAMQDLDQAFDQAVSHFTSPS